MAYINKCPYCATVLQKEDPRCPKCGAENIFYGVDMSGDEYQNPSPVRAAEPVAAPEGKSRTASTGKCPYCGSTLRSDEKNCPNCNAINPNYVEDTPRTIIQPKTIEELKEYCAERGMPLLRMRFFIGEDYREPRAFGIYRDGRDVVVYKNKDTGARAIRYRGPDEAFAVNELFQKLLSECHNRGIYPDGKLPQTRSGGGRGRTSNKQGCLTALKAFGIWILIMAMFIGILASVNGCVHRKDGYYSNGNGAVYYHYGNDWYFTYDDNPSGYWYETDSFPESNYEQYSLGDDWNDDWGVSDFRESSTWDDLHSSSDSDSSSDYDSWDSGGTDWGSDW